MFENNYNKLVKNVVDKQEKKINMQFIVVDQRVA